MNSDSPDTHHPIRCVVDADAASSSSSHRRTRIRNPRKKRTIIMDEDDHNNNNNNVVLKPKYGKKPDPGAPKITRPCTECGKKFWSWKALFGHMRCHPERQWRGINPPPNFRQQPKQQQQQQQQPQFQNMTQEDHEVAACLLLLANGNKVVKEDINLNANNGTESPSLSVSSHHQHQERFECSSCKKVFGSHQALGGHRASHKNVKGCFARNDGDPDNEDHHHHHHHINMNMMMIHSGATGLVGDNDQHQHQHVHPHDSVVGHKCSICLRVFSTGQALGGHKRCHWDKGDNVNDPSIAAFAPNVVDLNLPPPVEDHCSSSPPLTLDLRLGL